MHTNLLRDAVSLQLPAPFAQWLQIPKCCITTIATAIGEDAGTVEEVYEPFLIKEGFIRRTPRGREVTELAYKHLGRDIYSGNIAQPSLF